MFLIANIIGDKISISDIGITLQPRQAIDLHRVKTLIDPERSKDLTLAARKGAIKIIHKDTPDKEIVKIENNKEMFNKEELLNDVHKILRDEIKQQLSNMPISSSNEQVLNAIEQFKELLKNKNVEKVDEKDISPEKLVNIHTKVMEKMSKNVEGNISQDEEKTQGNSLKNNISELENLI
jgi:hypothetical protein